MRKTEEALRLLLRADSVQQARVQPGMEADAEGFVLDQTVTKPDRDFYELFFSTFQGTTGLGDYTIVLSERPARGTSSLIAMSVNDTELLEMPLPTRSEQLEEAVAAAVATALTLDLGEVRWLQTVTCPLPGPDGEALGLSIGTDITARVAAKQASQRAREVAEAAMQAKETFLACMSHEIRTPLNGVLDMADQLAKTPLAPQQQHLLSIVRTSGHFLLGVLNNYLDMSKISRSKLELAQAPFELCQLASEALALLAWQATDKGLDFACTPLGQPAPFPLVLGDSHRLNQVLVNLVGNALKFTSQGYVHVRSRVLAQTDDTLTLQVAVADSGIGIGIAADKQEVIFEFFTQASPDIQRQYGGSGLGLSLCRALVQRMGGTLTVASQPGTGSTFTVELTLPKAVPTLRPATLAAPPGQANSLASLRVLLVDDNEINRSVTRFQLAPWGTVLHEAGSGPEALALLAAQPFDVVLLDIQMPGMDGLEVLAALRRHPDPQRAATPAIAFTANAFRADTERYLAAGFASYLFPHRVGASLFRGGPAKNGGRPGHL
jgi:signal transduction histidine kinase